MHRFLFVGSLLLCAVMFSLVGCGNDAPPKKAAPTPQQQTQKTLASWQQGTPVADPAPVWERILAANNKANVPGMIGSYQTYTCTATCAATVAGTWARAAGTPALPVGGATATRSAIPANGPTSLYGASTIVWQRQEESSTTSNGQQCWKPLTTQETVSNTSQELPALILRSPRYPVLRDLQSITSPIALRQTADGGWLLNRGNYQLAAGQPQQNTLYRFDATGKAVEQWQLMSSSAVTQPVWSVHWLWKYTPAAPVYPPCLATG